MKLRGMGGNMHPLMLKEIVAECQRRGREGDFSAPNNFNAEQLEDAICALAWQIKILTDPNDEPRAGPMESK